MRISIQACVESGGSSSPEVLTLGCVERDPGVDPAPGMGMFVREAVVTGIAPRGYLCATGA
jgi:hypothetical protein